ncbi:carbohydrate kinase family protein [Demequina sediminicola]|uniref:carbohydrate kinase family protein n=1 Tax=Demequina sediminicola TaxID=1095026 RepID=UPI00078020E4|nr:carbohydrate kinase [Demequina sediminicola]
MTDHALVIGEALVDVVVNPEGSRTSHPGGSLANVALGLGRLGRPVSLLTQLADDAHGAAVAAHLHESHVTLAPGSISAEHTSVATATLDSTGAATYEFDLTWELNPDAVAAATASDAPPSIVHTGSIAAVLEPGAHDVAAIVEKLRDTATVTYDPNARPTLMGEPADARVAVERMVALADVVKVSDEDLEWLTQPGESIEDLAQQWLSAGPSLVVMTRGGDGATAFTNALRVDVPAAPVTVADTVGAGDSFMGGLIDGLWDANLLGAERREALRTVDEPVLTGILQQCIRIGAITVSRPGANPPTRAELIN